MPYRREDAVLYADRWWDGFNPEFAAFEVDCTNYISQSLFAGGAPINYTGKRESGWWYKGYVGDKEAWSYSWSVANALERFLGAVNPDCAPSSSTGRSNCSLGMSSSMIGTETEPISTARS